MFGAFFGHLALASWLAVGDLLLFFEPGEKSLRTFFVGVGSADPAPTKKLSGIFVRGYPKRSNSWTKKK